MQMKPTFYANWFELTELSDDSATRMMNRNEQRCRVGRFSFFLRILLVWCVASWRRVTQFGGISCGWWKQQSSNNGQSQSVWTENVSLFFWGKTLSNVASNGKSLRTNLNFWRDTSRDGWSIASHQINFESFKNEIQIKFERNYRSEWNVCSAGRR